MKGGKNDVTEVKASHWTVVTGSQEGGEVEVEVLTENDGMRQDQVHVGGKDDKINGWIDGVAV